MDGYFVLSRKFFFGTSVLPSFALDAITSCPPTTFPFRKNPSGKSFLWTRDQAPIFFVIFFHFGARGFLFREAPLFSYPFSFQIPFNNPFIHRAGLPPAILLPHISECTFDRELFFRILLHVVPPPASLLRKRRTPNFPLRMYFPERFLSLFHIF